MTETNQGESKPQETEEIKKQTPDQKQDDRSQSTPGASAPPCTCFCLVNWIAAIAAPYVPNLPNTTSTRWLPLPVTETEIESGDEFWTANVNKKDYNCTTLQIIAVTPQVLNLVHNTYSRSRTRTLGITGWGPWTPWTPYANTGNLNNVQALGTSAPPSLPECAAVNVGCP